MRTTPEKLLAALKRGLAPVYLLSGDEPLTQGEAADAIRAAARAAGFAEREVFFIDRANGGPWDEIFASMQALSLFAARRLIEIRIPGGKPGTDGAKALVEFAGLAGADVLLLVTTGGLDWTTQKSSWVQALDGAGCWVDAQVVGTAQFPAWLRVRAANEGVQLDDAAVALLAQQTEGNLLAAVQELQKLSLAGIAQAGAAEVLASGTQSSRFDVTQLGEAVLRGDLPRALRVLAGLKAEDVEPTLVLWSLWQELRALWLQLVPGAPLPAVWSRNKEHMSAAATRLKPLGRAFFARLDTQMAEADRIVKGRRHGNAWDALGFIVAEFAGGRALLHGGWRSGMSVVRAQGLGPLGIFGGTFDPVHNGHLRTACELREALRLAEVRFLPTGNPPHRDQAQASAEQRLALVRAAVASEPVFSVDDRETRRSGPSYSVDTLAELRAEFPQRSICLLLGMDAFLGLPNWHRWREILELAHVAVAHRPGWKAPTQGPLGEVMVDRGTGSVRELHEATAGKVFVHAVTQLEISSTELRQLIARGRDPRYLVPDSVCKLLAETGWYAQRQ